MTVSEPVRQSAREPATVLVQRLEVVLLQAQLRGPERRLLVGLLPGLE